MNWVSKNVGRIRIDRAPRRFGQPKLGGEQPVFSVIGSLPVRRFEIFTCQAVEGVSDVGMTIDANLRHHRDYAITCIDTLSDAGCDEDHEEVVSAEVSMICTDHLAARIK